MLSIIMLIAGIMMFIFARPLLHIVGPHLQPEQFDQGVVIMRLVALNPLFFTISGVINSVQQTFGRFFFFAIAPLFYNLAIIASVYIFKDNIGVEGLGVGAMIGGLLQLGISCLGLQGLQFKYQRRIKVKSADFKMIMRQLPARSIDQGVDSINSIVETNRATGLGLNAVSYYNYATTLQNVPIMLFGTAIATAAFPRLAERLSQKRPDLFHKEFFRILRIMIWVAMPVVVVSYFGRGYLARLIYGDVAPSVALIFGYLTVAIFFRIVYSLISRYYYAQKDTRTPLFISLITIALNIFLAFTLARPDGYGIAGLAMAQSIAAGVEVLLLVSVMLLRDPYLFNGVFWGACTRIVSVTGFSAVAAYIAVQALPLRLTDQGLVTLGFKFGFIAAVTILVHVGISALFGLEEAAAVLTKVRRTIKQLIIKPVRIQ
jgi:putative peptidoglycan lipid II flippase